MLLAFMRFLKRLILFAAEGSVLIFGFFISMLATYLASQEAGENLALFTFFGGLLLTSVGFFLLRRRTRKWKIEQEAAAWIVERSKRRLNPHRARKIRFAQRSLIWLPTICAGAVLFFSPAASHLTFAAVRVLPHYQFSLPLNWLFIKIEQDPRYVWALFSEEGAARYGLTTPRLLKQRSQSLNRELDTSGLPRTPKPRPASQPRLLRQPLPWVQLRPSAGNLRCQFTTRRVCSGRSAVLRSQTGETIICMQVSMATKKIFRPSMKC